MIHLVHIQKNISPRTTTYAGLYQGSTYEGSLSKRSISHGNNAQRQRQMRSFSRGRNPGSSKRNPHRMRSIAHIRLCYVRVVCFMRPTPPPPLLSLLFSFIAARGDALLNAISITVVDPLVSSRAPVPQAVVRAVLLPRPGAGAKDVRTDRVEYPLRV